MLTAEQLSKLLNRSLTDAETANFELYLKISVQRLEELLCMKVCKASDDRSYQSRYGYREVYVDPFRDIVSVTIDDEEVTEFTTKQNDNLNGTWYNIIEFDTKRTGEKIVVDAAWGFNQLPVDLQLLLARLFAQGSVEQTSDSQVKSKSIEDFSITFKDNATYDEFVLGNASIIDKYSQCNQSGIRHGAVRSYGLRPFYNY